MKEEHRFYINGEWMNSSSNELIEIENPSTEEVIGTISAGTREDIDLAVASAKNAFQSFGFSSKEDRVAILEEIIKNYEASAEDLASCISEEMGAPLWLSQVAQVASGLGHFKDTLAVLKDFEFESQENLYELARLQKDPVQQWLIPSLKDGWKEHLHDAFQIVRTRRGQMR